MECSFCHKHLNEGTEFCDACGEELMVSHSTLSVSQLDAVVLPPIIERRYPSEFEEELKKAYYLSQVKQEDSADSWDHIQAYFDFIYLRLMYEDDKDRFLESEYPKDIAYNILNALKTLTIEQETRVILQQRYGELYQTHQLPDHVAHHIPLIYDTAERDLYKRIKGRSWGQIIGHGLVGFLVATILFLVLGGGYIAYTIFAESGLQGITPTTMLDAVQNYLDYVVILLALAFAWGIQKGWNLKRVNIKKDLFQKNKVFKKQIRKEIKPLVRKVKRRKT